MPTVKFRYKHVIIFSVALLSLGSFFLNLDSSTSDGNLESKSFGKVNPTINIVAEIEGKKKFINDIPDLTSKEKRELIETVVRAVEKKNKIMKPIMETVRELFELASANPDGLYDILTSELNNPLDTEIEPEEFECPTQSVYLIDYPSLQDRKKSKNFKEEKSGTWVMYQHLRKAGGTGFCDLANSNMPRKAIPPYYCMPDERGSLATPPWSDSSHISRVMKAKGYRVAANEWDGFTEDMVDLPGAVLATTFRNPIDRWYSQYRFEHLERRDGGKPVAGVSDKKSEELAAACSTCGDAYCESKLHIHCMKKYYLGMRDWTMGSNYYVKTFLGDDNPTWNEKRGDFYWTYHKYQKEPITFAKFSKALGNLRKFHLILVLEWLNTAGQIIEDTLGWSVPPKQVLPHESQASRSYSLGKKSLSAIESIPTQDYKFLVHDNIYDLLLFYIAKRIYLERFHSCNSKLT